MWGNYEANFNEVSESGTFVETAVGFIVITLPSRTCNSENSTDHK